MVNKSELAPHIALMTFDRVESAKILGIPYTTLSNWVEELGLTPSVRNSGKRGVQALYAAPDLFRGMLAKVQLEGGLAKKAARATASVIMDLLDAAEVLTSFPAKKFGFLLGTGSEIKYVAREGWDDPAKLHKDLLSNGGLCWIIDLKQVTDDLLSAMIPVIQDHVMQEFGFVLDGPGKLGLHRLTLRDGTKLESETFDSLMQKLRRHTITAALADGARRAGRVDPDDLADMEDMARFVGYANAQEFSEDIANVRKTLQEISAK
jgi:hypothetical protein